MSKKKLSEATLRVIELFRERGEMSVSEVSKLVNIQSNSLHATVNALSHSSNPKIVFSRETTVNGKRVRLFTHIERYKPPKKVNPVPKTKQSWLSPLGLHYG